jgi:hypothetical protein
MFKGLLKTCGDIAVDLGVLSLIDVLHIEYPQGSGIGEQNFSAPHGCNNYFGRPDAYRRERQNRLRGVITRLALTVGI